MSMDLCAFVKCAAQRHARSAQKCKAQTVRRHTVSSGAVVAPAASIAALNCVAPPQQRTDRRWGLKPARLERGRSTRGCHKVASVTPRPPPACVTGGVRRRPAPVPTSLARQPDRLEGAARVLQARQRWEALAWREGCCGAGCRNSERLSAPVDFVWCVHAVFASAVFCEQGACRTLADCCVRTALQDGRAERN